MILIISNLSLIESYRNDGEEEEENTNGLNINYNEYNDDHERRLLNSWFKKRVSKHKLKKYDDINLLLKESFLNDRSKRKTN